MLLEHRIFLFKRGALETVFTIALILAVLTSLGAFVNHITARTQELKKVRGAPQSAVILGERPLKENSAFLQEVEDKAEETHYGSIIPASLKIGDKNRTVHVMAVDVPKFVAIRGAHVEGEIARENGEANVGEFLARMSNIEIGDDVAVRVGGEEVELRVVGVLSTNTQGDVGILVPRGAAGDLASAENYFSVIEVSLKENIGGKEALTSLREAAPAHTDVIGTAQAGEFIDDVNSQIVSFLLIWSLVICVVVAVVSGVGMGRLAKESEHEMEVLRGIGAGRGKVLGLMLLSISVIALAGSLIGISLGIVGSQAISAVLGWISGGVRLTPFLELNQVLRILVLALTSSVLGGFLSSVAALRRFRG